jgi:hypothetical protein
MYTYRCDDISAHRKRKRHSKTHTAAQGTLWLESLSPLLAFVAKPWLNERFIQILIEKAF